MARKKRSLPTSAKAKKILRENRARGKPLTARQKRFFGWVAGGKKPRPRGRRGDGVLGYKKLSGF